MKLAKLASLLVAVLALAGLGGGCKKGLDKTTQIPKGAQPPITDDTASRPRDIGPGTATAPPTFTTTDPPLTGTTVKPPAGENVTGVTQTKKNFDDWTPNRDEFKAQTVYFDLDKSNVKPSEVSKLKEVAARMKSSFQGKALRVEGHCDERGTEEYNRALGDRRALSVRETLIQLGMDPEMVPTISFGEEKPADPGHSEAAWSKNRRGELVLLSPP